MAPQTPPSDVTDAPATPTPSPSPSPSPPMPSPVPPPVPVETHPNRGALKPPLLRQSSDPNRLAPEDAYKTLYTPPRLQPLLENVHSSAAANAAAAALRPAVASLRAPPAIPPVAARLEQEKRRRSASRRRRQPEKWKKLLWIRQRGYPDNYTDTETFLDHLQRNPRLRPYDFWPLVADATVIVQHVCSLTIFICAYAGIYQDRLSPVAVVTCGSIAAVIGWKMWDHWMGEEDKVEGDSSSGVRPPSFELIDDAASVSSVGSALPLTYGNGVRRVSSRGLGLTLSTSNLSAQNNELKLSSSAKHGQSLSRSSFQSISPIDSLNEMSPGEPFPDLRPGTSPQINIESSSSTSPASWSHQWRARLHALKSGMLIFFILLGLSPILKSLTKSTSSDSIWSLATWLLIINIFFFDYGSVYTPRRSGQTVLSSSPSKVPVDPSLAAANNSIRAPPFPSSLSTNAAVMASTVLASRLPTTTAVFSLSLFSIQVFGLFPIFRRHLRHKSFSGHVLLTTALVVMSSCGLGLILSRSYTHTYGDCGFCLGWIWHVISRSLLGLIIGSLSTAFVMGGSSWWLMGLQRYKNVVIGPWDPAKPILAGGAPGRSRGGTD